MNPNRSAMQFAAPILALLVVVARLAAACAIGAAIAKAARALLGALPKRPRRADAAVQTEIEDTAAAPATPPQVRQRTGQRKLLLTEGWVPPSPPSLTSEDWGSMWTPPPAHEEWCSCQLCQT